MPERADGAPYRRIRVRPIAGALGAEVAGADLAALDDATFREIHRAFLDHLVLFFRDQELTPETQTAFARRFGPPHCHPYLRPVAGHPEVIEIVKEPGEARNFGGSWHADLTYLETPTLGAVLYAREVPAAGGDTLFANMYLAYETLSAGLKRLIDGLVAVHDDRRTGYYERERVAAMALRPDAEGGTRSAHPVVVSHPETGRRALFVSELVTVGFVGMTEAESRPILGYLFRHMTRPEFTCRFRWRPGSVALWDNRCTQHLALNDYPGARRVMQRVLIQGVRPRGHAGEADVTGGAIEPPPPAG